MKSANMAADIAALLRSRHPLIWVVTREEARTERYLIEAASAAGYIPRTWDVAEGVKGIDGKVIGSMGGKDPAETLETIRARSEVEDPADDLRGVWIMRDLVPWLEGMPGASVRRTIRNLARSLPGRDRKVAQAIILLTPSRDVPDELAGHATVIDWPMPDREEIAAILDAAIESLPDELKAGAAPNGQRDAAIDAAVGLSGEEAASCYARSLVKLRRIDPATVAAEKKRVISREGLLEWIDPIPGGIDAIGGLEPLKAWLLARKGAYSAAARAYGLPAPKGVLIAGIAGTGKSLTAKAIPTAWQIPCLRLDMGAMKGKFVGESEGNLRRAFDVIGAVGRCVVWIDEIDKAMSGANQGAADGGVSADALGALLNWMQERKGEAFVIATANDVESLPPELLRKGRFDEVFWVDLPTRAERSAILGAALKAHGRGAVSLDNAAVARVTDGFTGSEVASLVPDALYAAFAEDAREITTTDLTEAASRLVPLSKTAGDKITKLRAWAAGRARPASTKEAEEPGRTPGGRKIDLA